MTAASPLDQIEAEAAALDAETMPAEAASEAPAASNAEEWAKLPALFGSLLCMAMPELERAYAPANCLAWGREMDAVANAYGWNAADVLRKFGPWPGLILASLPMALPTLAAVRARRARPADPPGTGTGAAAQETAAPAAPVPGMLNPIQL